jgi:hypothetical protein
MGDGVNAEHLVDVGFEFLLLVVFLPEFDNKWSAIRKAELKRR